MARAALESPPLLQGLASRLAASLVPRPLFNLPLLTSNTEKGMVRPISRPFGCRHRFQGCLSAQTRPRPFDPHNPNAAPATARP
jgi:hypothetical protein